MTDNTNHWSALSTHWNLLESPLIPTDEDIKRMELVWKESTQNCKYTEFVNILLLGVTTKFANHVWSPMMKLTAVDNNKNMIKVLWPGNTITREVTEGDWLHLPFDTNTFDLIINDNGPTLFNGINELNKLSKELHRVIKPNGCIVMRNFSRPNKVESIDDLIANINDGIEHNFHALKMKFLMSLHSDSEYGIELNNAWLCFNRLFPDRQLLASKLGCSIAVVNTIDSYKDSTARYSFYSNTELSKGFCDFRFKLGPCGAYNFADRCTVFSLTPL